MYHYIIGITVFDLLRPYFRKHVLKDLHSHEFLFLNTLSILFIILVYFLYEYFFDRKFLHRTYENCKNLNCWQFVSLLLVSLLTVSSTVLLLKLDKMHNTPAVNNILLKSVSLILLFFVGIALFREQYSAKQILGIIITILGVLILTV
jgi:drug/metabolite transporter (DMT)-like permease